MCKRFTLRASSEIVNSIFDINVTTTPRYNIRSSQDVLVVHENNASPMQWGLIKRWSVSPTKRLTEIHLDNAITKATLKVLLKNKRCLIPADGYYEWKQVSGQVQPYFVHMKDDRVFAFAGLWDHWEGPERSINSCAILTQNANPLISKIHDYMPIILEYADYDFWIDNTIQDLDDIKLICKPYPADNLDYYPVSPRVCDSNDDTPELIKSI